MPDSANLKPLLDKLGGRRTKRRITLHQKACCVLSVTWLQTFRTARPASRAV
jgi:hypothetical protein